MSQKGGGDVERQLTVGELLNLIRSYQQEGAVTDQTPVVIVTGTPNGPFRDPAPANTVGTVAGSFFLYATVAGKKQRTPRRRAKIVLEPSEN
jgi:hypothetical protein